jgi:hypothetical protein
VKLKGEDNITSPQYTHQALWELELDTDTLKNISYQDGKTRVVSDIADIQGWKDLSLRAQDCIYNED